MKNIIKQMATTKHLQSDRLLSDYRGSDGGYIFKGKFEFAIQTVQPSTFHCWR